jgi:gliding motility-associated-like protein
VKIKGIYIVLFLSLFTLRMQAQINCDIPAPPVLNLVSVEPETGNTIIRWDLSPSAGVAAYVLYTYKNNAGIAFDTIWDATATSFVYPTPASKYYSVSYVVAAHRLPNCISPLSNYLNTIFAKAEIDTCNRRITVSWNSYIDTPRKVTSYTILGSVNGDVYSSFADLSKDKTSFVLDNFTTDADYKFIVKANLEGGESSKSNIAHLSTEMQRPPDWINADFATVADNKIELSFTVDPNSEISKFSLERKTGRTGSFSEIAKLVISDGKVAYIDNKTDIESINYYRLSAINSCDNAITVSNLASNLVLTLEKIENDIHLSWNSYSQWKGDIDSYELDANTGNGFNKISEISSSDTSYIVDYHKIMYDVTSDEVCFRVNAFEISNPHGINGSSMSQSICTNPVETITVPDVFTPNNDLINDLFKPVLSFTPLDYNLIISDRQSNILFETKNYSESWDGSAGGKPVAQGVYLWYLKTVTPSHKTISKTGTVTVYFNE